MRGWLSRSRGFWDCRDRDQALGWPDRLRLGPIAPNTLLLQSFQHLIGKWIAIAPQFHYPKLNAIDLRFSFFFLLSSILL
jgi:hypothetical protein